jgi:cytochrome c oxidase assembly protein subunit 11
VTDPASKTGLLVGKLLAGVVGMFVFAVFIMPPIYDVLCDITGLNGKTGGKYTAVEAGVDKTRTVKVQFLATNNEGMPWQFGPEIKSIRVHPGEQVQINYLAKNPTTENMSAQAVPSVVPSQAAEYFHKTECFCFNQQDLASGESTELGLIFIVDRDLPEKVHTITLSYTLFDITGTEPVIKESGA